MTIGASHGNADRSGVFLFSFFFLPLPFFFFPFLCLMTSKEDGKTGDGEWQAYAPQRAHAVPCGVRSTPADHPAGQARGPRTWTRTGVEFESTRESTDTLWAGQRGGGGSARRIYKRK